MRHGRGVFAVTSALLVALTGCSREIAGVAQKDPTRPGLALSEDGYGLVVGFPDAPVQVDFFTELQRSHCADLIEGYGDEIAGSDARRDS